MSSLAKVLSAVSSLAQSAAEKLDRVEGGESVRSLVSGVQDLVQGMNTLQGSQAELASNLQTKLETLEARVQTLEFQLNQQTVNHKGVKKTPVPPPPLFDEGAEPCLPGTATES